MIETEFPSRLLPALQQVRTAFAAPDFLAQERLALWQHFSCFES
jgi:hypothetical protein